MRIKAEMDAAGRPSWSEYRDVQLQLNHMAACIDWNVDVGTDHDTDEVGPAHGRRVPPEYRCAPGAGAGLEPSEKSAVDACRLVAQVGMGEQRKLERFLLAKNRALEMTTAALTSELVTVKAEVPVLLPPVLRGTRMMRRHIPVYAAAVRCVLRLFVRRLVSSIMPGVVCLFPAGPARRVHANGCTPHWQSRPPFSWCDCRSLAARLSLALVQQSREVVGCSSASAGNGVAGEEVGDADAEDEEGVEAKSVVSALKAQRTHLKSQAISVQPTRARALS